MLQKSKSPRRFKLKYLLVLPLLAFMLVVASCSSDEQVPNSVVVTKDMPQPPPPPPLPPLPPPPSTPFNEVDKVPVFPTCEGNSDLIACMNAKIQEHVVGNYNSDLGKELGLEGIDRKSTRLNSSHVATSYAVFCLTKKTIKQ